MNSLKNMLIAVDGPAASGKGTLAKSLANHFGLRYLDTGLIYRAVSLELISKKRDSSDEKFAIAAASNITENDLLRPELRDEKVASVASVVASYPRVRKAVINYQRSFAAEPPGAVLDGRDIGTVVCPDATAKIYLDANLEVRALRRSKELHDKGTKSIESRVLFEMKERDKRDRERNVAPLSIAEDAYIIDTSYLGCDQVFERAITFVLSKSG